MVIWNLFITLSFTLLLVLLRGVWERFFSLGEIPAEVTLGFILLASYSFARSVARFKLPRLNGYIFFGILAGPYFLNLISHASIRQLGLINEVALVFIALTAGGELKLSVLRQNFRAYTVILSVAILIMIVGVTASIFAVEKTFGLMGISSTRELFVLALILGVLAVPKSPATTIAVVNEYRARGLVTQSLISLVMMLDVVVILLFTITLGFVRSLTGDVGHFNIGELASLFGRIVGSLLIGFIMGIPVRLYFRYIRTHLILFILGLCLLIVMLSRILHLESILVGIAIGFYINNFTRQGARLIDSLEESSLPVYVVFFTIAGASLHLDFLMQNWLITSVLVITTAFFTFGGIRLGISCAKLTGPFKQYGYLGFISQAGLSIGLAVIVRSELPGELGNLAYALLLGRIAVNQIIGPILLRISLVKS